MIRPDMEAARLKAVEAKEAAKAKTELARASAKARKEAQPPKLVNMLDPTGDAEADAMADLDEVQAGFRARAKAENDRFASVTDSEYWFAVCFKTREQKEHFLRVMKWLNLGDKYLPGDLVAKSQGIELPDEDVKLNASPKIDSDYAGLSL